MRKKLLSLMTLLLCAVTSSWAQADPDYESPATKTYAEKTFLNIEGTTANKTDASSNKYLTYGIYYVASTKGITTWYNCSDDKPANNLETTGYTIESAADYGFFTVSSTAGDINYGGAKMHSGRERYFYVTGATSVAGIVKDNSSTKYTQLKIQEVSSDGTLGTATTIDGDKSTTAYMIDGGTLDRTKYYKITFSSNNTSNCYLYQVRFGKYTAPKAYTVTAATNDEDMGTAEATNATLDAGETTTITATPKTGYKFVSWAVSGEGASLSSTTANPTTLTMGTANATVTATFAALATYTISYDAGSATGVTGSKANETKYEDVDFTLPSDAVFTRSGYVQTGWSTTDGGSKDYELGGSYTTNAAQTFYPFWTAAYKLTYDANGGTGTMEDSEGVGSITLSANTYTKDGYSFIGWATNQANADAGTVAYADGADYTLSADATIYAVWAANDYTFTPTGANGNLAVDDVVTTSTGGKMKVKSIKEEGGIKYETINAVKYLTFNTGGADKVQVTLNKNMQAGTVITVKIIAKGNNGDGGRGLNLQTTEGTTKQLLGWTTVTNGTIATFSYTVKVGDGLIDGNSFLLARQNSVGLQSLTVANCGDAVAIDITPAKTYTTLTSAYGLDFTDVDELTAYIIKDNDASDGTITMTEVSKVPANTGLVIKATTTGTPINVPIITSGFDDVTGNNMTGSATATTHIAANGGYILSDGKFHPASAGDLPAGKAYLAIEVTAPGIVDINFNDDNDDITTGIDTIEHSTLNIEHSEVYNLNGQRVSQPTKGLYIVNGKKVIVK